METERKQQTISSPNLPPPKPRLWAGSFFIENRGSPPSVDPPHEGLLAHPRPSVLVDGRLLADRRRAAPPDAAGRLAHGAGPGLPVRGSEPGDGPRSRPFDLSVGAPPALPGPSLLVRPALPAAARGLRGARRCRRPPLRRERDGGPLGAGLERLDSGRARSAGIRRRAPARRAPPGRAGRR